MFMVEDFVLFGASYQRYTDVLNSDPTGKRNVCLSVKAGSHSSDKNASNLPSKIDWGCLRGFPASISHVESGCFLPPLTKYGIGSKPLTPNLDIHYIYTYRNTPKESKKTEIVIFRDSSRIYCFPLFGRFLATKSPQTACESIGTPQSLVSSTASLGSAGLHLWTIVGSPSNTIRKLQQHGGFLSHGATPSHHPFLDGIFPYKPSIFVLSYGFSMVLTIK